MKAAVGGARGPCNVAVLAALLVAGCAARPADPADPTEPRQVREHAMKPYAVREECLTVAAGERIEYYFTSSLPVDFNIHYHEGRAVVMPVVRDKTQDDSGLFLVYIAHDYCLMWEAGPAGAVLDYRLRLRTPAAAN